MKESAFKAYDIRGVYGKEIKKEDALELLKVLVKAYSPSKVVLAHDIRKGDKEMYNYVVDNNTFVDLICLGRVPTTIFYIYTKMVDADLGIIFTASHNPPEYVGIKIVKNGKSLSSEELSNIKHLYYEGVNLESKKVKIMHVGIDDIMKHYSAFISQEVDVDSIRKLGLNVVVDVSSGSFVSPWIDYLMNTLGIESYEVMNNVDDEGMFKCHVPDTSNIANYRKLIERSVNTSSVGIGFDGDGDRILVVLPSGKTLPAEFIAYIIAKYDNIKNILTEVSISNYIIELMKKGGMDVRIIRTGHIFMEEGMENYNRDLGVERSGHFYFKTSISYVEDALLALIKFLSIFSNHKHEIMKEAEYVLNYVVKVEKIPMKVDLNKFKEKIKNEWRIYPTLEIDGIKVDGDDWWFLVRKSNTEDVVRVIVEGSNDEKVNDVFSKLLTFLQQSQVHHDV